MAALPPKADTINLEPIPFVSEMVETAIFLGDGRKIQPAEEACLAY